MVFEDLMYQNLRSAGAASSEQSELPTGLQVGLGVRVAASTRNFSQGNLQQTGGNLDVAIKGQGFFQIQLPDGTTGYTRDGAFQVDANGQLVTNTGFVVQPGITIPPSATSVTIAPDGTINVTAAGQSAQRSLGQLQLASLRQSGGAGAARLQPLCGDRRVGHAQHRRTGQRRAGRAAAGSSSRAATSMWWRSWCR